MDAGAIDTVNEPGFVMIPEGAKSGAGGYMGGGGLEIRRVGFASKESQIAFALFNNVSGSTLTDGPTW